MPSPGSRHRSAVPRGRAASVRVRAALAALAALGCLVALSWPSPGAGAEATPPPSAFGSLAVTWIAVSPAYTDTGTVVAVATCGSEQCLWVTHDGGGSWSRALATGWNGGRIFAAQDSRGGDVLYSEASSKLKRSDDGGKSWRELDVQGSPAVSPTYGRDGAVAVAGLTGEDHLLSNRGTKKIAGSGGAYADLSFMFAPEYPKAGAYPPVLLAAADRDKGLPVLQRCDENLACQGDTTLAGTDMWTAPGMQLFPSGDYAERGAVFLRTGRGLYKSGDGGSTYLPAPVGDPSATSSSTPMFALAPGYREGGPVRTAYLAVLQIWMNAANAAAAHSGGGIYRTTDAGTTWKRMGSPSPLDDGAMGVAVAPDGRLFAAFASSRQGAGLLCSIDGGNTWRALCPPTRDASKPGGAGSSANAGPGGTPCASPCPSPGAAGAGPGSGLDGSQLASGPLGNGGSRGLHGSRALGAAALILALGLGGVGAWRIRLRRSRAR